MSAYLMVVVNRSRMLTRRSQRQKLGKPTIRSRRQKPSKLQIFTMLSRVCGRLMNLPTREKREVINTVISIVGYTPNRTGIYEALADLEF